jgi:two-component system sensor histidine kinase BaeS
LSFLRGEIEALVDGLWACSPERLGSLHQEVLALGKLVDDLYTLSISDLGAMSYRWAPVDLAELLGEVASGVAARFQDKGMALRLPQTAGSHLRLSGDAARLRQLFSNLLENSWRYTDPGGVCEIRWHKDKQRAQIEIHDSAPSVPAPALPQLFERLYRVDASRSREHGGAGLGLAICKNIVEAHNGDISAHDSPLGGLCIRLEFPLTPF